MCAHKINNGMSVKPCGTCSMYDFPGDKSLFCDGEIVKEPIV